MVLLAMDRSITLWRLIELKMELLVQCVPAFMLAIHWRGLRAAPTFWGLVVGTVIAVTAVFVGESEDLRLSHRCAEPGSQPVDRRRGVARSREIYWRD